MSYIGEVARLSGQPGGLAAHNVDRNHVSHVSAEIGLRPTDVSGDGVRGERYLVEQHYQRLMDHCRDVICVYEAGRLVYVNPAGVRWFGATSVGPLLGRLMTECVHPDSISATLERIASLRHIGDATGPAETVMLRLDGTPVDVESIFVLTMWEGKPAYQVIVHDMSAHNDAAEMLQRYRLLTDFCPDAIGIHQNLRWVYMNPAGIKWFGGISDKQVVGHPVPDFVHPDSVPAMLERIGSLRRVGDTTDPAEAVMLRLHGTPIYVQSASVLTTWEGKPASQVILRDFSAQKAVEKTLRYQAALVDHVSDAVITTTFSGLITSWNPTAETIYRCPAAYALGRPVSEVVGAPIQPGAIVDDGGFLYTTHYTSDGSALAVRVSATVMDKGFVLLCSDQTALRRAERHFRTVVTTLEEGVLVVGSDGRIDSVNPAAQRILGINDQNSVNDHFACTATFPRCESPDQVCESHDEVIDCGQHGLCAVMRLRESQTGHVFSFERRADGQQRWLSVNSRLLNPEDSHNSAMLISMTDITAQHKARERLAHEAAHDVLTGLPNRAQIISRIDAHLGSTGADMLGALLFIDLDNFKPINDTLGHHIGDQMLQAAATCLKTALRSSDVVGRLGGDEFVALILGQITCAELDELTNRIHTTLAQSGIADDTVALGASIGIVMVKKDDGRDGSQILRDADSAMYQAKTSGGGTSCYFTENCCAP